MRHGLPVVKISQIILTVFYLLLVTIFIPLHLSAQVQSKWQTKYNWGAAELAKTFNGAQLRFILYEKIIKRDVNSLSALTQLPVYTCFVQISPGTNITSRVQRYSGHNVTADNLNPAIITSIRKLASNISFSSSSLVKVEGYRCFRGKRLAQLNILPYIYYSNNLQTIDTIEVVLQYGESSRAHPFNVNIAKDQQFQSVYEKLILNPDDNERMTTTESLQWPDSTRLWLPQNFRSIKLTIPNDGIYRLPYANLTTLAPELY